MPYILHLFMLNNLKQKKNKKKTTTFYLLTHLNFRSACLITSVEDLGYSIYSDRFSFS